MKTESLTLRLDGELARMLARESRRVGRSRSAVAREALRRWLVLQKFESLRRRIAPFAEAAGFLTDEDVFDQVS